uniref:Uncharacterized protein n=1 Tax=Arundo donax TaxID=35708 RepID=A0A0A9BR40_ARUDO
MLIAAGNSIMEATAAARRETRRTGGRRQPRLVVDAMSR